MRSIRYIRANPTGNITCLVVSPVAPENRERVTGLLMDRCEQVGYLSAPTLPGTGLKLEMMGGEFCGNATMAAGAFLARQAGVCAGETVRLNLEVSGAEKPVSCRIRALEGAWEGTVDMPRILEVRPFSFGGRSLSLVRMEGIVHLINREEILTRQEAEELLRHLAPETGEAAAGLLHWNEKEQFMTPLVYVPSSGTMVWESGCGSGSTALGALLALEKGDGVFVTDVRQPGGLLRVRTEVSGGRVAGSSITGRVTMEEESRLRI